MKAIQNPVIISESDYDLIKKYVVPAERPSDEMSLANELARATIVKNEEVPENTVRIGSVVRIRDVGNGNENTFTIVSPEQANIKAQKISVLTPIGSALIGFRVGDRVEWKLPAGLRTFEILEVTHQPVP